MIFRVNVDHVPSKITNLVLSGPVEQGSSVLPKVKMLRKTTVIKRKNGKKMEKKE